MAPVAAKTCSDFNALAAQTTADGALQGTPGRLDRGRSRPTESGQDRVTRCEGLKAARCSLWWAATYGSMRRTWIAIPLALRHHQPEKAYSDSHRRTRMANKNTICLWYDGTALDAARFYAETFPDRKSTRLNSSHLGISY